MLENLGRQIGDAFLRLGEAFLSVIPAFVVLVGALLVGLVVGVVIRLALNLVFRLARQGDSSPLLRAAGFKAAPSSLAAGISFWAAVLVALAVGVNALEPGGLKNILADIVAFLPRLLTSALIVLVGFGLAALARRSVLLAAVNSGLPWARAGSRARPCRCSRLLRGHGPRTTRRGPLDPGGGVLDRSGRLRARRRARLRSRRQGPRAGLPREAPARGGGGQRDPSRLRPRGAAAIGPLRARGRRPRSRSLPGADLPRPGSRRERGPSSE